MEKKVRLFLDSGAFSAQSQGVGIDIQDYIAFIKKHDEYIEHYAVLDVIGDAEKTLENQKIMEAAGLHPIPCFHYGEDEKYLQLYIDNYDYIALGGMVPVSTGNLMKWLDHIFGDLICDQDGMSKVKVHGFGMTTVELMLRYPFWSVDSTSWIKTGRHGGTIIVPKLRDGKFVYDEPPMTIKVSDRLKGRDGHYDTLSEKEKAAVLEYIKRKGYKL